MLPRAENRCMLVAEPGVLARPRRSSYFRPLPIVMVIVIVAVNNSNNTTNKRTIRRPTFLPPPESPVITRAFLFGLSGRKPRSFAKQELTSPISISQDHR